MFIIQCTFHRWGSSSISARCWLIHTYLHPPSTLQQRTCVGFQVTPTLQAVHREEKEGAVFPLFRQGVVNFSYMYLIVGLISTSTVQVYMYECNKLSLIVVSYHVADKMVRYSSPMKAHFTPFWVQVLVLVFQLYTLNRYVYEYPTSELCLQWLWQLLLLLWEFSGDKIQWPVCT